MSHTDKIDQGYAAAQDSLDQLLVGVEAVLNRKRERHGEQYDSARALYSLFPRLHRMSDLAKTVVLATALERLLTADDPDPFAEIADLDFEVEEPNDEEGAGE